MKISVRKIGYVFFLIIVVIVVNAILENMKPSVNTIKIASLLQFSVFILGFILIGKNCGKMLTLYSTFLIAFYLFQNGQLLLYSLNVKYNYYYVTKYSTDLIFDSVVFSTYCLEAALAAGMFSFSKKRYGKYERYLNSLGDYELNELSFRGMMLTGVFAVPYMIFKIYYTATRGYLALIQYAVNVSFIIKGMEKIFIGFMIMSVITESYNYRRKKEVTFFFIIWNIVAAFSGDRTVGLAGISVLLLYKYNTTKDARFDKKILNYC